LLRAYVDLVRGATAPGASNCFVGCTNVTAPFLTPPVVLEAGALFAQATVALVSFARGGAVILLQPSLIYMGYPTNQVALAGTAK
jgi:hypothetical protein